MALEIQDPPVLSDREAEIAGLDALDVPLASARGKLARAWEGLWPKLTALGLFLFAWQAIVWSHWKPDYVLPGPMTVLNKMWHDLVDTGGAAGPHVLLHAAGTTMQRAVVGYGMSVVIGVVVGLAVSRSRVLRAGVGSMITGLQTMPTIAWLPLAVLLFKLSETAITFVVVMGAAPAIANGVISGVDHIPPVLLRAGRVLGARGLSAYRFIILPAALPGLVAGLKQGWAFAWRSLMAGELIVIIAHKPSLGVRLQNARDFSDAPGLMAAMLAIFVIGVVIDSLFFGVIERGIRRRWGLGSR
jgi:NitT/TauT family transport system permease protein